MWQNETMSDAGNTCNKRGRLKIFFGYAAGTGKTWAMLEAGKTAREKGADVVIGYLEPHDRPDTSRKAEGLETVPCRVLDHKGLKLREMDTDAVIARAPQIALVVCALGGGLCWWMNWPTPTQPDRATGSGTGTSRSCWCMGSMSIRP